MRLDGVPRVVLNFRIFPDLKFEIVSPKSIRLRTIDGQKIRDLNLRVLQYWYKDVDLAFKVSI